jgi:hypothetical protein
MGALKVRPSTVATNAPAIRSREQAKLLLVAPLVGSLRSVVIFCVYLKLTGQMPGGNWPAVSLPATSLYALTPATIGQSANEGSLVMSDGNVSRAEPIWVASGTVNVRGPLTELTVTVLVSAMGAIGAEVDEAGADAGSATGDAVVPLLDVVTTGAEAFVAVPPLPPPQAMRTKEEAMAKGTIDFDVFIFRGFFNQTDKTK